jgi:hypothetical protein
MVGSRGWSPAALLCAAPANVPRERDMRAARLARLQLHPRAHGKRVATWPTRDRGSSLPRLPCSESFKPAVHVFAKVIKVPRLSASRLTGRCQPRSSAPQAGPVGPLPCRRKPSFEFGSALCSPQLGDQDGRRAADRVTAKNRPRLQPLLYEPYAGNPALLAQGLRVRRHSLAANPFSVLNTVIVGDVWLRHQFNLPASTSVNTVPRGEVWTVKIRASARRLAWLRAP